MAKHEIDHSQPNHVHVMTLREVIREWWAKRFHRIVKKQALQNTAQRPQPVGITVNHIAVVLDGVVEEVIRAENRLAALFLSEPKFIMFDPEEIRPTIGWGYDGERFIDPNEAPKEN